MAHAQVPAYARFINERFERCLDLYLCPRARRKRVFVPDARALVPKLPRPRDLQPFPTALALRYLGHTGPVRIPFALAAVTSTMPQSCVATLRIDVSMLRVLHVVVPEPCCATCTDV